MAVTSYPQILEQSNDFFTNAAYNSRVQTFNAAPPALTINPTDGLFSRIGSIANNVVVSFTGIPGSFTDAYNAVAYQPTVWYVEVNQGTTYKVTFTGVTWSGGTTPTLVSTSTGKTTLMFTSFDGTTINGAVAYSNLAS